MSTLLIAVSPGEAWGALEEDGAIVELRIARRDGGARPGALYLGRIVALKPDLPAALVDIGEERAAFLSADDAQPRKGLAGLTEGAAVLVQVKKEARADKATGVTLRPLLEGAFVDLRPGRAGISMRGRRIDAAERQRLSAALARLAQEGEGFDLADRAQGASDEALAADVAALRARWQAIETARARAAPPARLEPEEGPAVEIIAAFLAPPPTRIVLDERAAFAEARQWLQRHRPALASALEYRAPAFDDAITAQVDAALAPRVMLPGGGALTLETTAAATMIDVDSGGAPALGVNLAAARVAARQIRLRNLAGPIVIDFIALRRPEEREQVRAALAAALARDPAAPQLLGWTRLGHMELMRPRRHAALDEVLLERSDDGGRIKTALTIALEALRAAARAADAAPGAALQLRLAPEVAACLQDGAARAARLMLEARLGRALQLRAEPGRARARFDIAPA